MFELTCPTCHSKFVVESPAPSHLPFCGPRCQTIDLGRWLRETYSVPHTRLDVDEFDDGEMNVSLQQDRISNSDDPDRY